MFTVIFLVKRKASMTQEEFADYWINQHTHLTAKVPGMRSYICYTTTGAPDGGTPVFDGVAVCSFESEADYKLGLASPEFATAVADGPNFQNTELTTAIFADEHVIV
jgi:uncharacterized protein (TIGR02118 family)